MLYYVAYYVVYYVGALEKWAGGFCQRWEKEEQI